jgi:hypothetical protein
MNPTSARLAIDEIVSMYPNWSLYKQLDSLKLDFILRSKGLERYVHKKNSRLYKALLLSSFDKLWEMEPQNVQIDALQNYKDIVRLYSQSL